MKQSSSLCLILLFALFTEVHTEDIAIEHATIYPISGPVIADGTILTGMEK